MKLRTREEVDLMSQEATLIYKNLQDHLYKFLGKSPMNEWEIKEVLDAVEAIANRNWLWGCYNTELINKIDIDKGRAD